MTTPRLAALGLLLALVAAVPAAAAPPGTPDPAFGAGGVTRAEKPHDVLPVTALRSGNRVVGVGTTRSAHAFVAGFAAGDGTRDPAYGGTFPLYGADKSGTVVAAVRQSGGRIVLATFGRIPGGDYGSRIELLGLDPLGHLDPTFGTGGRARLSVRGEAAALAIAPNGTLLVGGLLVARRDGASTVLLARVSADGYELGAASVPDSALPSRTSYPDVAAVVPLPDGSALVAGTNERPFLARFTATGALDTAYGTRGVVRFGPSSTSVEDAVLQDPGHVLIGGAHLGDIGRSPDVPHHALLLRTSIAGAIDRGYGPVGRGISDDVAELSSLHLDGAHLVAGTGEDDRVVSFDAATGRPDLRFGVGGVSLRPRQDIDWVNGLTLDGATALIAGRSYLPDELERLNVVRVRLSGTGIPKPTRRRVTLSRGAGRVAVRVPLAAGDQPLGAPASVPLVPRVVGTDEEAGIFTPAATIADATHGTVRVTATRGRAEVRGARITLRRIRAVVGLDLAPVRCGHGVIRTTVRVRGPFEVRFGKRAVRNRSHVAGFVVRRCGTGPSVRRLAGRLTVLKITRR
jgi:hypothetical protein